jgi:hypothetical protein
MTNLGYPCARTAKPNAQGVLRVEETTSAAGAYAYQAAVSEFAAAAEHGVARQRCATTPRSRSIRVTGDAWSAGAGAGIGRLGWSPDGARGPGIAKDPLTGPSVDRELSVCQVDRRHTDG